VSKTTSSARWLDDHSQAEAGVLTGRRPLRLADGLLRLGNKGRLRFL
jgi:hypothetical protein